MYKIVVFIPEMVFVLFILLPVFLVIGGYYPDQMTATLLSAVGLITGIFWMAGISDYIDKSLSKKKTDYAFNFTLIVFSVLAFNEIYKNFSHQPLIFDAHLPIGISLFILDLILAIWLTIKVKKIFTERSTWFLFLEIVFYGFGVATLTPEFKNHYRLNRKKIEKNIFSDDETIL